VVRKGIDHALLIIAEQHNRLYDRIMALFACMIALVIMLLFTYLVLPIIIIPFANPINSTVVFFGNVLDACLLWMAQLWRFLTNDQTCTMRETHTFKEWVPKCMQQNPRNTERCASDIEGLCYEEDYNQYVKVFKNPFKGVCTIERAIQMLGYPLAMFQFVGNFIAIIYDINDLKPSMDTFDTLYKMASDRFAATFMHNKFGCAWNICKLVFGACFDFTFLRVSFTFLRVSFSVVVSFCSHYRRHDRQARLRMGVE
jgi:hypothetical protein